MNATTCNPLFFVARDRNQRAELGVSLGVCPGCEGAGFWRVGIDHSEDCPTCNGTGGEKRLFGRAAIDFADHVKLTEEQGHQYTAAYEQMVSERYPVEVSKS